MKTFFLMLSLSVVFFNSSFGKEDKIEFGKINKSDLEMTFFEADSSAHAVILYEKGTSSIKYNQKTGWRLVFRKHQRIKILKKEGVKYADFQIGLTRSSSEYEVLYDIKGSVFNLDKGKIVESELSKKEVYLENVNKNYDIKSFTLPNVKEGSVIDVQYAINCKTFFRNMRPWMFQHDIPTIHSEYYVSIPEYFNFRKFVQGFENFEVQTEKISPSKINLTSKTRVMHPSGYYSTGTEYDHQSVDLYNVDYHWIAKDMPAFVEEAYVSTVDNYIQQVQFELQTIKFPESQLYTYSKSWESINSDLIDDDDFGKVVFGSSQILKQKTMTLIANAQSDEEKVYSILNYIHTNFKYTNIQSIYSKGFRKTIKDLNGNVADLNFLLVGMLKEAGFQSNPVVLSTRENGLFLFPTVTGFNYVIAQCEVRGQKILLDAADVYSGYDEIPFSCLNGRGMVVGKNKVEWVDFYEIGNSETKELTEVKVEPDGKLNIKRKMIRSGYAAARFRQKVDSYESEEKYLDYLEGSNSDWDLINHSLENMNGTSKRNIEKMDLVVSNKCINTGERLFMSPMIFNPVANNPFKLPERKYPVDFGYKHKSGVNGIFTIPQGYVVEEIPKPVSIALTGRIVQFIFNVGLVGDDKINVVSSIIFNKAVYNSTDYEGLKQIYDKIVEKHQEQIILKKL